MKMNQNSDGFWTHFWATVTAIASAAGLTTEQWIYVFCAVFGALLSLASYLNNKKSLRAKQAEEEKRTAEDQKRTEILRSYLAGRENTSESDAAGVAEEIKEVMHQVGS
ncbi:hypothetical protein [Ewingella americana]